MTYVDIYLYTGAKKSDPYVHKSLFFHNKRLRNLGSILHSPSNLVSRRCDHLGCQFL